MRKELFSPTIESEARLLILINAFSGGMNCLEGRTKLAKLDFFLRYPMYLKKALEIRKPELRVEIDTSGENNIENKMVRYRYGPWDPAYFNLLGRLIGRGLIRPVPYKKGIGFKVTGKGNTLVNKLSKDEEWAETVERAKLLKANFNLSGTKLKNFIYDNFPQITQASWGEEL